MLPASTQPVQRERHVEIAVTLVRRAASLSDARAVTAVVGRLQDDYLVGRTLHVEYRVVARVFVDDSAICNEIHSVQRQYRQWMQHAMRCFHECF